MSDISELETAGVTSFARCGDGEHRLFSINPHIPANVALEYASMLQNCASQLMLDAAMGEGERHIAWAAFYMGEMAAAIVDDVSIRNPSLP
ncbi:hypothetical protein PMM47T1_28486 [Pseudomonas sp. M47T1]|uniref:DUF3077 domain-containing protein n=1 Tax=Pseudomonas sp. M47T1 TaxID=1179778 RepID=UPI0002608161|nr:DUF3077 domain-containing protein [Pseudomonas sp. M47T1]EIK93136.1 hypothetical protein PMM47T1_28486 [Pseudomonas sp. M47T1]